MPNYMLDILAKISSKDYDSLTQKEILLAVYYQQEQTANTIKELKEAIHSLSIYNTTQDSRMDNLAKEIKELEIKLKIENAKKEQLSKTLSISAIIISAMLGLSKIIEWLKSL